jgi:hypothetical protein
MPPRWLILAGLGLALVGVVGCATMPSQGASPLAPTVTAEERHAAASCIRQVLGLEDGLYSQALSYARRLIRDNLKVLYDMPHMADEARQLPYLLCDYDTWVVRQEAQ